MPHGAAGKSRGKGSGGGAGNGCICGKCNGKVGGSGNDAGYVLSANMDKRMRQLRLVLGPGPYPPELLLPAGKKSDGCLGNLRIAKHHYVPEDLKISIQGGKVRRQAAGRAEPRVPLADITGAAANAATPGAAGGQTPATAARPARGERAEREQAQAMLDAVEEALKTIEEAEEEERVAEGTAATLRARLEALEKSEAALQRSSSKLSSNLNLHKLALKEVGVAYKSAKQLKKQLKKLKNGDQRATLSYERFTTNAKLAADLDTFVFFPTMEALEAWLEFMGSVCPLDKIVWLDTARWDSTEPPAAKKRKRAFPLAPRDALVAWLFILRTGTGVKRAARLFGVSKQTMRRAFYTMTRFHVELFDEEFFALDEAALKAIIPDMMRTFAEHEGVQTAVAHIIDGFECKHQKPTDLEAQAGTFSHYKNTNTAKFLLDILSNGAFYFVSDAYGGSLSDPELTRVCGFLKLMKKGIDVMADKGFQMQADLEKLGNLCWIPPVRRRGQEQGTAEEAEETHHVANKRIYVENGVRRIKEFDYIGSRTLSVQQKHLHSDVVYCMTMLCNMHRPLVPVFEEAHDERNE